LSERSLFEESNTHPVCLLFVFVLRDVAKGKEIILYLLLNILLLFFIHLQSPVSILSNWTHSKSPEIQQLNGGIEKDNKGRLAICLVGAARAFELSGSSLKKYLLDTYSHEADVFLHSPLDKDSYKFLLLKGASSLTVARIFIPQKLPESNLQREVLTAVNSPNGIQVGLHHNLGVSSCFLLPRSLHENQNQVFLQEE
jgi:hypothetical protein